MSLCPILPGQRVLDLGCGIGDISAELSARSASLLGIDENTELLDVATIRCPECRFEKQDLNCLQLTPAAYDGIWSSFTAAYFVDFASTFARWLPFLRPNAWVCIIDIDGLLGHNPMSESTQRKIASFYEEAANNGRYDFRIGGKIESVLRNQCFHVTSVALYDQELSFDGPASKDVIQAWRDRFSRMGGLKAFWGNDFSAFEDEFIHCISDTNHQSLCKVVCCVGVRTSLREATRAR